MTIPFTVTLVVTERDEGNLMTSLLPKIQAELNRIERSYSAFLPTSLVCRYQMGEKTS
jgi:thiamine biosynthesis lipoprotein